jgi:hypothetical protein
VTVAPEGTRAPLQTFVVVWAGQLVSITGTMLTGFGLMLFVFAESGSTTKLSFVALSSPVWRVARFEQQLRPRRTDGLLDQGVRGDLDDAFDGSVETL